jgi:DNA repair protein RecO (recombination protein O)
MPDESDTGLIINKYPYSETSLIVIWLTKNHGIISTSARGVYRQNSAFFGKIDLFYLADFDFRISPKSDLYTLKDISLIDTFPHLRKKLTTLNRASYCAFLIQKMIEKNTPVPEIFELFLQLLKYLINDDEISALIQFEIIVLSQAGELYIHEQCRPEVKTLIQELVSAGKITENFKPDNRILGELHTLILKSLPENEQLIKLRRAALQHK